MMIWNNVSLLTGSCIVALSCFIVFKTKKLHINYTNNSFDSPQRIHDREIPRIGGLCLVLGMLAQNLFISYDNSNLFFQIFLCTIPAFFSGFLEDVTNKIDPFLRLFACLLTSILFVLLTQTYITTVGMPYVDHYLTLHYIAFLITVLSIVTLTQSINIIDGLNGLAIGTSIIILASILIISKNCGDIVLTQYSILTLGLIIPLFIFNFPNAKIFLGDGGAYFLGTILACYVILLSERNDAVSPFCILLIIIFPVYELIRSLIRRIFNKDNSPFSPDSKHFHSLIFKYLKNFSSFNHEVFNPIATIITLILPFSTCILAISLYKNQVLLIYIIIIYIIFVELMFIMINFLLSKKIEDKA